MGFKGLERPAIVLAVDGFHPDVAREVMYVGLSRARDELVVCGDIDEIRKATNRDVAKRLLKAPD
jgi:ATP-dependent exoDNAse (exonuclease V) alpha subunit